MQIHSYSYWHMRLSIFLVLFFSFQSTDAQKKYTWKEFMKALSSGTSALTIEENDNLILGGGDDTFERSFETNDPSKLEDGKLIVNREVNI